MNKLRRHPGLSHFTPEQFDLLERSTRALTAERGDTVVSFGEPARVAYIIQSGAVEVRRNTAYGDYVLNRLATGDLFGELALLDGAPRSSDVIAVSDLDLRTIDPAALQAAAGEDPTFEVALYWVLWKSLARKLRTSNQKLVRFFHRQPAAPARMELEPPEAVQVSLAERQRIFYELGLSNMEVNYMASLAEALRLQPHQLLLQDGDTGSHMYVVLQGRIMISKHIPGAGEEALAFLGRGELVGEMALIDGAPRCADAKADEDGAVVLSVRREVLDRILDIRKASSIRMLRILCRHLATRLRESNEKLVGWYILSGGTDGGAPET